MLGTIVGKPGIIDTFTSQDRNVFWGNRNFAAYIPLPLTIDGNLSSNPANSPYVWNLFAGQPFGKITASKKFRPSIIGLTAASYTSGATSLTTDANTATEVARLITYNAGSITLTITGPPTSSGTVAAITTTCSAASGTSLTITNLAANVATGSLIQPGDGSQTIATLLCEDCGQRDVDAVYTTRVDVFANRFLSSGNVVINTAMIWPGYASMNASTQTYVKAAIVAACPGAQFQDQWL